MAIPAPGATSTSWTGRDLLGLQGLSAGDLRTILRRARDYDRIDPADPITRVLVGRTVATLFFEDSTRTRTSFSLAARRLGASVADLTAIASSVNKGETLMDTALAIQAMGVDAMVIRARQNGAAAMIAGAVSCPVVNAGDGRHEHPTQGLLDTYQFAAAHRRLDSFDLSGLTMVIVGDLGASRVARSGIVAMTALGARVYCVGPVTMVPRSLETLGCQVRHSLDEVLGEADAVMVLRIQFERQDAGKGSEGGQPQQGRLDPRARTPGISSVREYREFYSVTPERASRMKAGAVVMHPGPINRGIELDSEVADGPRSAIMRQVSTGVAVRMGVLSLCMGA